MTGPRNSLGKPWREDQAWSCARCGQSGPDRDDVMLPECDQRPYHNIKFSPPEHAAAIAARRQPEES